MSTTKRSKRKKEDKVQHVTVSKQSLDEAIALVYEDKDEIKANERMPTSKKMQRECWSASLKAQNMKSVAENFSPDHFQTELLEELRVSLLENNFSASAKILQLIIDSGNKMLLPIIWKTAAVLFLNCNPNSYECLEEFLEMCADQRSSEDKKNFIETLVALPDVLEERFAKCRKNNKNKSVLDAIVLSDDENETIFN